MLNGSLQVWEQKSEEQMINLYTLYSGSSGNCALVTTDNTNILIDAGVSAAKIVNALNEVGVRPDEIDAILITHEHSDHIAGLDVFLKKFSIPVYANAETVSVLKSSLRNVYPDRFREVRPFECFEIRDARIYPFDISHDAIHPMGYSIMDDETKISFVTDMGNINETILKIICKSEAVLIESNYDEKMLMSGFYPWNLKKRILGEKGHLSNDNAAWIATQLVSWGTKHIALGHLSENNNTPQIAYDTVYAMLESNSLENSATLTVAPRSKVHKIL